MRSDISELLVHFTKGSDFEEAYQNLKNILLDAKLCGSSNKIRDGSNCICFSEAPYTGLKNGLVNPSFYSPYSPFGVIVRKEEVYRLGGRPVIYQSEGEFGELTQKNSWRHVRFEPPAIDFTWEREWRLKLDEFCVHPGNTQVLVPDASWSARLIGEHNEGQAWQTLQYSQIMDSLLAVQYEDPFPWFVVELNT